MISDKDLLDRIAVKSRLEDLGEKASVLGHELRQPLFTIAMANENLRLMMNAPDIPRASIMRAIDRIEVQVQRAQTIIALTLGYAAGTEAHAESADVEAALRNAADFLKPMFDAAELHLEIRASGSGKAGLNGVQQEQIFVNILRNAVDSIEARRRSGWSGAGAIRATIEVEAATVRCVIADNGAGLGPDTPERAFRPFSTTKAREGTGLGLYVCEQIVAIAGGSIRLLPGESEGARVEVLLPLHRDTAH